MGTLGNASRLTCAAVLASALFLATAPSDALARAAASASSYRTVSGTAPTHSHSRSRSHSRHAGARCARYGVRHGGSRRTRGSRRGARRKASNRSATHARAHARTRGTRCGTRRGHTRSTRHAAAHRRRDTHAHVRDHTHAAHRGATRNHAPKHALAQPSAGSSSECANASLMPSDENLVLVRAAILCLINRERTSVGERALVPVGSLDAAARSHSDDMGYGDYFEHVGPRGDTPSARMRAAGYLDGAQFYEVGENIAFGTGSLATPRAIVAAWMASPGHRANILDSGYRDTGIGVCAHPPVSFAGRQRGAVYTEDFGVTSG